MTDHLRWTISELQARYELEPNLSDVYVEGAFDRDVLSNVPKLKQAGNTFYEIDAVDVPASILEKYGLTLGNKQRVIALARELDVLGTSKRPICLVDKDLDHWFGPLEATAILRWTKYCSIELHFLEGELVREVLISAGHIKVKDFDTLYESLASTLRVLYALRLADRQCSMEMKWVALKKYLVRDGDMIIFAVDKYATALLATNGFSERRDEFNTVVSSWLDRLVGDVRQYSRGHDFQTVLAWIIREFKGLKDFASEPAIERLFVLLARSADTLAEELQ